MMADNELQPDEAQFIANVFAYLRLCEGKQKKVRRSTGVSESSKRQHKKKSYPLYNHWRKDPTKIPLPAAKFMLNETAATGHGILHQLGWYSAICSIVNCRNAATTSSTDHLTRSVDSHDQQECKGIANFQDPTLLPGPADVHISDFCLMSSGSGAGVNSQPSSSSGESCMLELGEHIVEGNEVEGNTQVNPRFIISMTSDDAGKTLQNGSQDKEPSPEEAFILKNGKAGVRKTRQFDEILRHVCVRHNISMSAMSEFLKLLHASKPQIDYAQLPKSGRQLLKVSKEELDVFLLRNLRDFDKELFAYPHDEWVSSQLENQDDDDDEDEVFHRPQQLQCSLQGQLPALYAHFGIEKALLGQSPGMVFKHNYKNILKILSQIDSNLLPATFEEFYDNSMYRFKKGAEMMADDPCGSFEEQGGKNLQRKPHFVIDVNIDGVQFFKNSCKAQGVPILGRIHSIGKHKIPIHKAPPFLIGIYHGPSDGLDMDAFLHDFITELKRLDPANNGPEVQDRLCRVSLRLMICDAPMRHKLKGIVSFSGYWSCERCRIQGKKGTEEEDGSSGMYFPDTHCPHRIFSDWDVYQNPEPTEPKNRAHRRQHTRFDELKNFDLIRGFSTEPMHTFDGGIIIIAVLYIFGLRSKRIPKKSLPPNVTPRANKYIDAWAKCTPDEINRSPRNLMWVHKWKMAEGRTFLMYLLLPLFVVLGPLTNDLSDVAKNLVKGVRLLSGSSLDPIPQEVLNKGRKSLFNFFIDMKNKFGLAFATYKSHLGCLHAPDDCMNYGVHLDAVAAYPFENQQPLYIKLLRSGKGVLNQIASGLVRYEKYLIPDEELNGVLEDTFEEALQAVKENNGKLALPPLKLKCVESTAFMDKAICEGFYITSRFPNNIVRLHSDDTEPNSWIILAISAISQSADGLTFVRGRRFLSVRMAFTNPFDSSEVSLFRIANLSDEEETYPFSCVSGKYYAVHEDLVQAPDPFKSGAGQRWLATLLRHSETPP